MNTAKVISLRARALQITHLCFEIAGIVAESKAQLGSTVTGFDFKAFYDKLGQTLTTAPRSRFDPNYVPTPQTSKSTGSVTQAQITAVDFDTPKLASVAGDQSRLIYDSAGIQNSSDIRAAALVSLRAESRKAALDKAVNARQNVFYGKYTNAPAVIDKMREYYSEGGGVSKPDRLSSLSYLLDVQNKALVNAYTNDGLSGVIKATISQSTSVLPPGSGSKPPTTISTAPGNKVTTTTTTPGDVIQTVTNYPRDYRIPSLERQIQSERLQINLIDERLGQYMNGQNLPSLPQVFANELRNIDLDIKQLQLAHLATILMSPIDGIVTGIYKQVGDWVQAGEPVIRVENNATVILIARLKFPGWIKIGSTVKVDTNPFDSNTRITVMGNAVAVRGHRDEDDRWDVMVSIKNVDNSGNPILPLGYHFDYDNTVVTVS